MIQRIQTVFLVVVLLAFAALFKFPFAESDVASQGFMADNNYDIFDNIFLMVLAGLGVLISLIAIFLFRNRVLQLKLSYLAVVLSILVVIVAIVLFYNEAQTIMKSNQRITDSAGLYMPAVSTLFGILAARFIGKDEKTIRSMDRLR
jgi:hypothetical protein